MLSLLSPCGPPNLAAALSARCHIVTAAWWVFAQGVGRIIFVDVSSAKYRPSKNMGITEDEAMTTIHAIRPDGSVLMVGRVATGKGGALGGRVKGPQAGGSYCCFVEGDRPCTPATAPAHQLHASPPRIVEITAYPRATPAELARAQPPHTRPETQLVQKARIGTLKSSAPKATTTSAVALPS